MMHELLKEQVEKYVGDSKALPAKWQAFLQIISDTYNDLEKRGLSKEKTGDENADATKELKLKLRNDAEELKKSHNHLGRILNSVNHGFFSRNMITNKYTYLSLACERIYGYTIHEFFENSMLWYDVILPEDRGVVEMDNERLNNKEEVCSQYRIIHKNKSIRWIEITIIPFFKNDKLCRVDGVVTDITDRKQVETEREMMLKELTRSNADLKQFSYITSHNLRAPLSNIQGILNLFEFAEGDDHNRQMLELLKASTEKLNKTIQDISQILVIKNNLNPELTYLDLKESFSQVMQVFTMELEHLDAKVYVDFKVPAVLLNKIYFESIFINLISNAIKYHSPQRKLVIKVESATDESGNVVITFSDNGTGIDLVRHRDRVFGLYQRFHPNVEGQGLGLFIMKSQIEATGGQIAIESEPGIGTTFILTFPQKHMISNQAVLRL